MKVHLLPIFGTEFSEVCKTTGFTGSHGEYAAKADSEGATRGARSARTVLTDDSMTGVEVDRSSH